LNGMSTVFSRSALMTAPKKTCPGQTRALGGSPLRTFQFTQALVDGIQLILQRKCCLF
jgi:hypothetical protein